MTPSIPSPQAGIPNPLATTGGRASGKELAEKKEMFNVGWVYPVEGGKRTEVAKDTFSGMEKKEGMVYLRVNQLAGDILLWLVLLPIACAHERVL